MMAIICAHGHRMATGWPQDGHRMATGWPQDSYILAIACHMIAHALQMLYKCWKYAGSMLTMCYPQPDRYLPCSSMILCSKKIKKGKYVNPLPPKKKVFYRAVIDSIRKLLGISLFTYIQYLCGLRKGLMADLIQLS